MNPPAGTLARLLIAGFVALWCSYIARDPASVSAMADYVEQVSVGAERTFWSIDRAAVEFLEDGAVLAGEGLSHAQP